MTPGRPPPTVVRRTAWEFAGSILANSGRFESIRAQKRSRDNSSTLLRFYPLRDYS